MNTGMAGRPLAARPLVGCQLGSATWRSPAALVAAE